ncbi:MAG TPA: TraB/GumN family protein [Rhizomicrobium sp.]|nr:TraB/GumN family protein [Rhizomicrobium sp.]
MRIMVLALASLMALGGVAAAQEAPPVTDWSDELVVVDAAAQGPALWHIKKGDSEIFILGTVGLMPEKLAWNTTHLEQAIEGANAVLLPPQAHSGILDILGMSWFLLTHRDALSMPDDQKLEASLPPELRARFVRDREAIGKDAEHYEDDSPLLAGFELVAEYTQAKRLTGEGPENAAEKIARAKHVKVRRIADYSANPLIREMLELPRPAGQVCFESALDDYDTLDRHAVPAAEAWAVGDVAGIKAHYSSRLFGPCIAQAKKFGEIDRRAVSDTLNAVHEALARPGKSVMISDIGWLFREGGVADQLKAEGIAIESPSEEAPKSQS